MLKFLAKLWFCKILDKHPIDVHTDENKKTVLRCTRCGLEIEKLNRHKIKFTVKEIPKLLAKLWFCYILGEHTTHVHADENKEVVLRCGRYGFKIKDKEVLDEISKKGDR